MSIFFYFLVIWNFFGIHCVSTASENTEKEECVYLKRQNLDIININNPLIEGLDKRNDSWYRQVNWSQQPRDYLKVNYFIWRMNKLWELIGEGEIFLCANEHGTEAGAMTKLVREALGIGERCPINLGINEVDPALFDGKKCRAMNLSMKLNLTPYSIFFGVREENRTNHLMTGFVQMSLQPF